MDQERTQPSTPETAQPAVDQNKLNFFLQQIRDEQSLSRGFAGGAVAALVGATVWAAVTYFTGFQIGWMAVGVGFLVGYAVRYTGKGIDTSFGIVGAILSLVGCLGGNLFASCAFIADQQGVGFMDVVSQLDLASITEIFTATFSPMDLLFYGIAVYEGYRFSFRQITQEELRGVTR
jgi:hypothetical protein